MKNSQKILLAAAAGTILLVLSGPLITGDIGSFMSRGFFIPSSLLGLFLIGYAANKVHPALPFILFGLIILGFTIFLFSYGSGPQGVAYPIMAFIGGFGVLLFIIGLYKLMKPQVHSS